MVENEKPYGPYSEEFAEAVADLYGEEWVQDQIARTEDPRYLPERLGGLLASALDVRGLNVLDYGCGPAASSVVIAKLGANVTGVDPDAKSVKVAVLRIRDLGMQDNLHVQHVPDTRKLPFGDKVFDVVVCNGTIEHIRISERQECVREMWRVLKTGGHLFICNSPNSWWPIDSHTTHLPLVPYMPLSLARRFAIMLGKAKPEQTVQDLLEYGIRGASHVQIVRWIRPGRLKVVRISGEVDRIFKASMNYKFDTPKRRIAKRVVRPIIAALDHLVLRPLHMPTCVITPYLAICLQKLD